MRKKHNKREYNLYSLRYTTSNGDLYTNSYDSRYNELGDYNYRNLYYQSYEVFNLKRLSRRMLYNQLLNGKVKLVGDNRYGVNVRAKGMNLYNVSKDKVSKSIKTI